MFNKIKLSLLTVCIIAVSVSTATENLKFKRGVVIGDDQDIEGHITSRRDEDIIIGGYGRRGDSHNQYGYHATQRPARVPQKAGVYAGVGAGINAGVGDGRQANSRNHYKRSTTVITSPNGVYIGTGNKFGEYDGRGAASEFRGANSYRNSETGRRGSTAEQHYDPGYHNNEHGQFRSSKAYSVRPASGYNDGIQIGDRNRVVGSISAH